MEARRKRVPPRSGGAPGTGVRCYPDPFCERDPSRAHAGARPAPDSAPLHRSGSDRGGHLPAGGAGDRPRPRGAVELVDHRDVQRGAVVAPLDHGLGARRGLRRRRRGFAHDPVDLTPADGERPVLAGLGARSPAQNGRVLLRRRVRAVRGGRALALGAGPVALRDLRPARPHAIEPDHRVRQPEHLHPVAGPVFEQVPHPRARRALQRARTPPAAATSGSRSPTPARPPRSRATRAARPTSRCSTWATAGSSTGAASRPRRWPG